jgi:predicted hotdog family 3-hydroxylacyl-ACP dehydratase
MMDPASIPVAELLPHGPKMILIDRLVAYDAKQSVAAAAVRRSSKFFDETGVPAWVGIEYMAQTVAAHAGFEARLRGSPPTIGFLLGTRSYECRVAEFPLGADLRIIVEPLFTETGLGSFSCAIEHEGVLAHAVISTYQPGADEIARIKARLAES